MTFVKRAKRAKYSFLRAYQKSCERKQQPALTKLLFADTAIALPTGQWSAGGTVIYGRGSRWCCAVIGASQISLTSVLVVAPLRYPQPPPTGAILRQLCRRLLSICSFVRLHLLLIFVVYCLFQFPWRNIVFYMDKLFNYYVLS